MKNKLTLVTLVLGLAFLITGCERPSFQKAQNGFRGTGMVNIQNPRINAEKEKVNQAPPSTGMAPAEGEKASRIYQNVQVLGNLVLFSLIRAFLIACFLLFFSLFNLVKRKMILFLFFEIKSFKSNKL